MKKLFSLLLVLFLLTGSACASTYGLMAQYNYLAKCYGAPELTEDMLMGDDDGKIAYDYGNLYFIFIPESNYSIVYGADSADFLPACVCASLTVTDSTTGVVDYLGQLLYAYMMVKSGKDMYFGNFGMYNFTISSKEDYLLFSIGEP